MIVGQEHFRSVCVSAIFAVARADRSDRVHTAHPGKVAVLRTLAGRMRAVAHYRYRRQSFTL